MTQPKRSPYFTKPDVEIEPSLDRDSLDPTKRSPDFTKPDVEIEPSLDRDSLDPIEAIVATPNEIESAHREYLESLGVKFCPKCGSRETFGLDGKPNCPTLATDCPIVN